jgi:hypothetical protein
MSFNAYSFFPILLPCLTGVLFDHDYLEKLVATLPDQPQQIRSHPDECLLDKFYNNPKLHNTSGIHNYQAILFVN